MQKDVEKMEASCDICQRHKYLTMSPGGLHKSLAMPKKSVRGDDYGFHQPQPKLEGYTIIWVIVDWLSMPI